MAPKIAIVFVRSYPTFPKAPPSARALYHS